MVSAHNNGEYLAEYVVLLLFHSDLQGMHWSCSSYTQALHKVFPGIAGRRAHEAKTLAAKEHQRQDRIAEVAQQLSKYHNP
jgi:hypothetical protein